MRRTTAFLAVALVSAIAAPLPAAEAAPRPARLRWQPCHSDVAPNLECARTESRSTTTIRGGQRSIWR